MKSVIEYLSVGESKARMLDLVYQGRRQQHPVALGRYVGHAGDLNSLP